MGSLGWVFFPKIVTSGGTRWHFLPEKGAFRAGMEASLRRGRCLAFCSCPGHPAWTHRQPTFSKNSASQIAAVLARIRSFHDERSTVEAGEADRAGEVRRRPSQGGLGTSFSFFVSFGQKSCPGRIFRFPFVVAFPFQARHALASAATNKEPGTRNPHHASCITHPPLPVKIIERGFCSF